MALSRVQYEQQVPGNKNFTVPMPYISRDHIKVSVDGVDVPFSWLNDSTVQLHTAPPLGAIIDVRRETERNVLLVDFQDASTLTEYQLDLAALQSFFLAQEAFDATGGTMAVATDGSYSANNRRISNVGYPNSDGDAANVKYVKDVLVSGKDAFEERLLAEAARNKAQQWADANENVQVESGKYSAKHHAAKASQSAAAAAASEANALTYRDQANSYRNSAAISASDAAALATAAASSATTAINEAARAKSEADRAQGYASGMNLPSAAGNGGKLLMQKQDESGLVYIAKQELAVELGLGTAATRDVTTSPTDTTAGRVLKVGDFGVGGAATGVPGNNIDNSSIPAGFYYVISTTSGTKPAGDDGFGHLIVSREGPGTTARQLYLDNNSDGIWTRVWSPSQWSTWKEVYHSGNIAKLISYANLYHSGNLADAFKGANQSLSVNGYQKLPGGLIIQWGRIAMEANESTKGTITFPIAFPAACLQVITTVESNDTDANDAFEAFVITGSLTTTTAQVRFGSNRGSWSATNYVRYLAIGY